MHTENVVVVAADLRAIYALASAVERWAEILPHYRWVRVLRVDGNRRLLDMAARRDIIPVRWQAEQVLSPEVPRVTFRHVGGITRGMAVEWTFEPTPQGVRVAISHDLNLGWPLVGGLVSERIIGPLFVENIAAKTLARIKTLAERSARESRSVEPQPPRALDEGTGESRATQARGADRSTATSSEAEG